MGIQILGTGTYLPKRIMTNEDFTKILDTTDEWIVSHTGIHSRHYSTGENTCEMGAAAAELAIENAGVQKGDVAFILLASFTQDYLTPSGASCIQRRLSMNGVELFCMDVNAACCGFIYCLRVAEGLLSTLPQGKLGLVVAAETLSKVADYTDRSTCILFGDGSAAAVVGLSDEKSWYYHGGEGDWDIINCPGLPLTGSLTRHPLYLNGPAVYRVAVKAFEECICKVLAEAGMALDDIDLVVPHQANGRILDTVEKKMKARPGQFINRIADIGNLSACTIPIMLDQLNREGTLRRGMKLLLVSFAGGLSWGANIITW